ncbi:YaeQ family protein [Marinospirillum perlucidum]|uniref:YaeQ family protein n=1 Tax=Marinospirillum perlucidum TaxID=1982602 RepID=UPI000DF436EA|nr:YaeQ family protein [Marinospirillum perlucidum]
MAQKARVIKARLQLADMQRHYYQDHNLTLAQHPSETDLRLMIRLLAFALNASEELVFARDLSDEGEPELAEYTLQGDIRLWIVFGQPDEKWLRKACQQAERVKVYAYGGRSTQIWWQQEASKLERYTKLQIWEVPEEEAQAQTRLMERSLQLNYTISEGQVLVSSDQGSVTLEPKLLKDFA